MALVTFLEAFYKSLDRKAPESQITEDQLIEYYNDKIAKWQTPDKVIFVDAIPLSGTGKMLKRKLREEFGSVLLNENA